MAPQRNLGLGHLLVLLLTLASVTAFSTQPLAPRAFSTGTAKSYVASPILMKQHHSTSTKVWGQSENHTEEDDSSCSENSLETQLLNNNNIKAASVVSLVLLATATSAALPAISHAVDLSAFSGGAATASGMMAKISETGFYQAFSLVFLSEIGDKTFFIAGLLSMKTSKFASFVGSMGALAVMTVISVLIGQIFHVVPAGFGGGLPLDDIAACLAFAFFGFKTLKDALDMQEGDSVMDEELAEAEEEVESSESITKTTAWGQIASIFALVFAAEFGDRSFLSTIALSAAQNPVSVGFGAVAAHGVATGIAVSGGAYLAKYISERAIGIIGGCLFLVFAVTTALGIF